MGDVVNFVNPFSSQFLGGGGEQQRQSSFAQQQSGFAQFPELQKAIAEMGFRNVQALGQQLESRATGPVPQFQLGPTGLFPQQEQAFRTALQQGLGAQSGRFARQGMLRPEHELAIAGAAARDVLPSFLPLIGQQVTQAQLTPEQITQNRINQLLQLISTFPGLMGGASTQVSTGVSNFPPVLPSVLGAFAGGFGSGLGSSIGGKAV